MIAHDSDHPYNAKQGFGGCIAVVESGTPQVRFWHAFRLAIAG